MANINGINNSSSIVDELGLGKTSTQSKKELGQSDFLELLVAQMKNQDPLEPQSNGDFMAQLAQFSTSDGISRMEESLNSLTSSLQSNQALQASALVGRTVLVPGDTAELAAGGQINGKAELPGSANNVLFEVFSASGELVDSTSLGMKSAGSFDFSWDGNKSDGSAATPGQYTVKLSGKVGEDVLNFGTMVAANVDSVSLGQNGAQMKLNVAGIGPVSLNDITQISE